MKSLLDFLTMYKINEIKIIKIASEGIIVNYFHPHFMLEMYATYVSNKRIININIDKLTSHKRLYDTK
jgi:hypothetical protein